ncbi:MAG: ribonuclease Z [Candidatus Azotimanducaceae bacterium]|jgi:ribonuclease Z
MNQKFRKVLIVFGFLVVGLLVIRGSLKVELVQDTMLDIAANQFAQSALAPLQDFNGLRVFVCGSASPLGISDQAQACIAVLTPDHFYIVDSGAGSTANLQRSGLPMKRLQSVLLTHYHSDHIAELYELNLSSWVQGRPNPLDIYGPEGISEIVENVNGTYRQDRTYRVAHHGSELLSPELGVMKPQTVAEGRIIQDGELTITAYSASHLPVEPSLGYRFDYQGRSVVISGDSLVTQETIKISDGVDLLLHDALSLPIVSTLSKAANSAGLTRIGKIMSDVMDYHASVESLVALADSIQVKHLAFYHLVPVPVNILFEEVFLRDLPANYSLAKDGTWFELPTGSDELEIRVP